MRYNVLASRMWGNGIVSCSTTTAAARQHHPSFPGSSFCQTLSVTYLVLPPPVLLFLPLEVQKGTRLLELQQETACSSFPPPSTVGLTLPRNFLEAGFRETLGTGLEQVSKRLA